MTSGRFISQSERLIVALDTSADQALELVKQLKPLNVTFKIGMELFFREGMPTVRYIQQQGCFTFVDLKLHDIPNTVERAAEALVEQGVTFFNVHAQGGPEMMKAATTGARRAAERTGAPEPLILGVTLLTSISEEMLHQALQVHGSVDDYVLHLAEMVQEAGLNGVVCSAREARMLRKACGPGFVLATPGIRPKDYAQGDDQARVVTPGQALQDGANFIVVGRPITGAEDPLKAARAILAEMDAAALSR